MEHPAAQAQNVPSDDSAAQDASEAPPRNRQADAERPSEPAPLDGPEELEELIERQESKDTNPAPDPLQAHQRAANSELDSEAISGQAIDATVREEIGANGTQTELAVALSAWVTAISTFVLAALTGVLAWATWKLFREGRAPQVVAALEANKWSRRHVDLVVQNSGNATAFDVEVLFSPQLPVFKEAKKLGEQALGRISLLRPEQSLSTFQCEFSEVVDTNFEVVTKWKRHPSHLRKETLKYSLNVDGLKNRASLGAESPEIQIADNVKKIREDLKRVLSGYKKLRVDIFSSADREAQQEADKAAYEEMKRNTEKKQD